MYSSASQLNADSNVSVKSVSDRYKPQPGLRRLSLRSLASIPAHQVHQWDPGTAVLDPGHEARNPGQQVRRTGVVLVVREELPTRPDLNPRNLRFPAAPSSNNSNCGLSDYEVLHAGIV